MCVDASTEGDAVGWLATRKLSRGSDESLRDDLLSVRADETLVPFIHCGGRGWGDVELVVEIQRLAAVGGCTAAAGSARRSLASASGGSATETVGAGVETAGPTARVASAGVASAGVASASGKAPAASVAPAARVATTASLGKGSAIERDGSEEQSRQTEQPGDSHESKPFVGRAEFSEQTNRSEFGGTRSRWIETHRLI